MLRNVPTSRKQCGTPNWKDTMSRFRQENYFLVDTVWIIYVGYYTPRASQRYIELKAARHVER